MNEKVIIIDIPADHTIREQLTELGLALTDGAEMTAELLQWDGWQQYDPRRTLLVFPGNGASIVRGYMLAEWLDQWQWVSVHAKRYWIPGQDPQVVANRIFPERMVLGFQVIVVVDDVVSSGKTCRLLRQINDPWIPGATWQAVSWIKQRAGSLRGFVSSHAVREYGTSTYKVPINSLSTLVQDSEIAKSYAQRHFSQNPETFLQLLSDISAKAGG